MLVFHGCLKFGIYGSGVWGGKNRVARVQAGLGFRPSGFKVGLGLLY